DFFKPCPLGFYDHGSEHNFLVANANLEIIGLGKLLDNSFRQGDLILDGLLRKHKRIPLSKDTLHPAYIKPIRKPRQPSKRNEVYDRHDAVWARGTPSTPLRRFASLRWPDASS